MSFGPTPGQVAHLRLSLAKLTHARLGALALGGDAVVRLDPDVVELIGLATVSVFPLADSQIVGAGCADEAEVVPPLMGWLSEA